MDVSDYTDYITLILAGDDSQQMQLSGVFALLSSSVLLCTADPFIPNPADYVLPFIGTTNGGHVFPGMKLTISIYLDAVLTCCVMYRCNSSSRNGQGRIRYQLSRKRMLLIKAQWPTNSSPTLASGIWRRSPVRRYWLLAVAWFWNRWCTFWLKFFLKWNHNLGDSQRPFRISRSGHLHPALPLPNVPLLLPAEPFRGNYYQMVSGVMQTSPFAEHSYLLEVPPMMPLLLDTLLPICLLTSVRS